MSTPLSANECRRQVRYDFTKDERIQKAITLGESLDRYGATEAELSRIKKDYTARLEGIQAEVDGLNLAVRTGYELREYICYWTYDEPRAGRKTLRKREGGDIVAGEDMTERDRQMIMEIIEAQSAVAKAAKGGPLALPAMLMPRTVEDVLAINATKDSFDFDAGVCVAYAAAFCGVFLYEVEGEDTILRNADERDASLAALLSKDMAWLTGFVAWLREDIRANIPGTAWLADAVNAHLKGERIRQDGLRAKDAADKKAARKRRAPSSGTVDVPSDEGSRDDAGEDNKNNL